MDSCVEGTKVNEFTKGGYTLRNRKRRLEYNSEPLQNKKPKISNTEKPIKLPEKHFDGFCECCTNVKPKLMCNGGCNRLFHIKCVISTLSKNDNKDNDHSMNDNPNINFSNSKTIVPKLTSPESTASLSMNGDDTSKVDHEKVKKLLLEECQNYEKDTKHRPYFFQCFECRTNTHNCFICKQKGSKGSRLQRCVDKKCGKMYHGECLQDDKFEHFVKWTSRHRTSFRCPHHVCSKKICKRRNNAHLRKCFYCPTAFHRNCCPLETELPALQIMQHADRSIPDWKFDLIVCNRHPQAMNGQFGRDDEKHGAFVANFDKISSSFALRIPHPISGLFTIAEIEIIKSAREAERNPFPHGFKKRKTCKWVQPAKKPFFAIKKMESRYMPCQCSKEMPCTRNCLNAQLYTECFDELCSLPSCHNRVFQKFKQHEAPIQVQKTSDRGFGASATRDIEDNELVVEYTGEIITKDAGDARLVEMNKRGAANFYFIVLDRSHWIDATCQGNIARFINHSCQPNCRVEVWDVRGVPRCGIFANCKIEKGAEITYDYKYQVKRTNSDGSENDNVHLTKCLCGSKNCKVFLGFSRREAEAWKKENKKRKN